MVIGRKCSEKTSDSCRLVIVPVNEDHVTVRKGEIPRVQVRIFWLKMMFLLRKMIPFPYSYPLQNDSYVTIFKPLWRMIQLGLRRVKCRFVSTKSRPRDFI